MRFNDPKTETRKAADEAEFNMQRLNIAKDRQLCYESKYDLINHRSHLRPTGLTGRDTRVHPPDSRVPYNLVSHQSKADHVAQRVPMVPPDV